MGQEDKRIILCSGKGTNQSSDWSWSNVNTENHKPASVLALCGNWLEKLNGIYDGSFTVVY